MSTKKDDPHYREDKNLARETLQKQIDEFLANGGVIEKLPSCMTSEEYYKNKKGKGNA